MKKLILSFTGVLVFLVCLTTLNAQVTVIGIGDSGAKKECKKSVGDDESDVPPGSPAGSCHTASTTCKCA